MIIHVTEVKVVGPHSLELAFDNGVRKRVNLRRELYDPVFEPLRDPAYFAQAYLDPDSRTVPGPTKPTLRQIFYTSWSRRGKLGRRRSQWHNRRDRDRLND